MLLVADGVRGAGAYALLPWGPKKDADDEKERSAAGSGGNSAAPRKRGDEGCGDGLDEMAGFSARV